MHFPAGIQLNSYGDGKTVEQWVFPYLYTTEVPNKGMLTVGKLAILDVTQSELNALSSLQLETGLLKMPAVDSFWRGELMQDRILIITSKTRDTTVSVDQYELQSQRRRNVLKWK
jgi:hypothetical protein